jgi:hypothetical protein
MDGKDAMDNMKCSAGTCKKKAVFRTKRKDKYGTKDWCERHFADKIAKYALEVERI